MDEWRTAECITAVSPSCSWTAGRLLRCSSDPLYDRGGEDFGSLVLLQLKCAAFGASLNTYIHAYTHTYSLAAF